MRIQRSRDMNEIHEQVQKRYGAAAASVRSGAKGCCYGPTACGGGDPITSNLYSDAETGDLPANAVAASLGRGNPAALVAPEPGHQKFDLGPGGGNDVLL